MSGQSRVMETQVGKGCGIKSCKACGKALDDTKVLFIGLQPSADYKAVYRTYNCLYCNSTLLDARIELGEAVVSE